MFSTVALSKIKYHSCKTSLFDCKTSFYRWVKWVISFRAMGEHPLIHFISNALLESCNCRPEMKEVAMLCGFIIQKFNDSLYFIKTWMRLFIFLLVQLPTKNEGRKNKAHKFTQARTQPSKFTHPPKLAHNVTHRVTHKTIYQWVVHHTIQTFITSQIVRSF